MAKALHYNFAIDKSLVARLGPTLNITRATSATYFDSSGVMQTAAAGQARFDHNPSTGESLGLLVEEARTNICLQSEDFSTTWTKVAEAAVNTDDATAPDGSLTADQLIDDGLAGSGGIWVQQAVTVASATDYVYSIFAKADQEDKIAVQTAAFDASGNGLSYFDLTTGTVLSTSANHSASGIEAIGNGWYRCWVIFQSTTDLIGSLYIQIAEGDGDVTWANHDGTISVHLWGAQLEAGAFPTSYIKTETISVARNVENVNYVGISAYLNLAAGTLYADFSAPSATTTIQAAVSMDDGGSSDRIEITASSLDDNVDGLVRALSVNQGLPAVIDTWADLKAKASFGYDATSIQLCADGLNSTEVTGSFTLPVNLTTFRVGIKFSDNHCLNGHIKEIRYYDERLSNEVLQNMSNGEFPDPAEPVGMGFSFGGMGKMGAAL